MLWPVKISEIAQNPCWAHFSKENVDLLYNADVVSSTLANQMVTLPSLLDSLPGRQSRASGMETVWQWTPGDDQNLQLVVRQHVHGGFFGRILGRYRCLFLNPKQAVNELQITLHVLKHGINTVRPAAIRIEKKWALLHRIHYVTELIPQAHNLLEICQDVSCGRLHISPSQKKTIAVQIGKAIARLHDAGVYHTDLNLKNIMIKAITSSPSVYIIDFKKAKLKDQIKRTEGYANLKRLDRSIRKWPASRQVITNSERDLTAEAYNNARSYG
jgi:tRNA A-37 threonylcarbamoyl transferase component Bud32